MQDSLKSNFFKDPVLQNQFDRDGYVIIDFLTIQETNVVSKYFYNANPKIADGFYAVAYSDDNALKDSIFFKTDIILQRPLNEVFTNYKKLGSSFLCKAPGESGKVNVHQDWTVVDESKFCSATIWVPTQDVSDENGALRVLPGSHLFFDTYRSNNIPVSYRGHENLIFDNMVVPPVKAGQAFVLNHAILHASSANRTNKERLVLAYGIASREAPLYFYHMERRDPHDIVEKFEMPDDFFQRYYNQGERPLIGQIVEKFEYLVKAVNEEKIRELISKELALRNIIPSWERAKEEGGKGLGNEFLEKARNIQSLTISIPAYNDSQSLIKLVNESQELCHQLGINFRILIINDGSTDNTLEVAKKLAEQYSNVEVISHDHNMGFGETLKQAFMTPKTEWVLFLPGDNQFPISNLTKFLEIKDDYDYIIGFRKNRKDSWYRMLYSGFYNALVSAFSGFIVRDVNSIVFYRSKIFDKITLKGTSAFVHAEFFIRTRSAGFQVTETNIFHQEREFGFGSGGNFKVILATVRELFLYIFGRI